MTQAMGTAISQVAGFAAENGQNMVHGLTVLD